MDVKKIQAFVDLATTLNYTKTAERLFSSQATVSKQILSLEKALGVKLFSRAHRQVALTEVGTAILPNAKRLVHEAERLTETVSQYQQTADLTLTIHSIPSISQYRAFNLIAAFHAAHPEVALHFAEAENENLLTSLDNGNSDVVFLRLFSLEASPYEQLVEEQDQFAVVLPKSSPLAQRPSLTMADLSGESFLLLNETTDLYQPVMDAAHAAGVTPNIIYKGQRIDLILGMISRGMGLSVMMQHSLDLTDYPAITTVPLEPQRVSYLAFLRSPLHHSRAGDLFWAFVQQSHVE